MKIKNIVFIGDFVCGKSQILNRLEKNNFSFDHETKLFSFKKIYNINLKQKIINFVEAPSDQDEFEKCDLSNFDGVIFVFDFGDKDSFLHIGNYYIHEFLEKNKKTGIIGLLGNKCDISDLDREVSSNDFEQYVRKLKNKLKKFIFYHKEVSAKLNININEFIENFIEFI